jgi:rod shape determining protein RodA
MRGRKGLLPGDPVVLGIAVGLAIFGVAMIYSAGELEIPSSVTGIWRKQLLWLVISLVACAFAMRVSVRWLEWVAPAVYAAALLSLVVVLAVGGGGGPRSWIRFGPVGFQPAEFAKLATVMMVARLLAGRERPPDQLWELWPFVAVTMLPLGLILLQPDLGTAAVFFAILLAALFWSGLPLARLVLFVSPLVSLALAFSTPLWGLWFLSLIGFLYVLRAYLLELLAVLAANIAMGVLVLPAWRSLAGYQRERILSFVRPEADPQGGGWHLIQSQVAIGSGGWLGKGFLEGSQKRLAFLPEQHTDFIVSVVGEELGFVGVTIVLIAFSVLLWRVLVIAEESGDRFASMVTFGVFAIWFAHLVANVGMTVGLLPITGLPVPFLSYGGSFLLTSFLAIALVQRIAAEGRLGV